MYAQRKQRPLFIINHSLSPQWQTLETSLTETRGLTSALHQLCGTTLAYCLYVPNASTAADGSK